MFIGVDVGTQSVRSGVFTEEGQLLGHAARSIGLHLDQPGHAEQSGDEIWQAVGATVREALAKAGVIGSQIRGIGFDATCSLVLMDKDDRPLSVNETDPARNIIVWMDHRAEDQANRINATRHGVLRYVGGRISPEMQIPKLLWLKENRPAVFASIHQAFDLSDFLTWNATGSPTRSTCTTTCKWTYLAHEQRWDASFFHEIGLAELVEDEFTRIGSDIVAPGTAIGQGLSAAAAAELGLVEGTPVSAGLIDAHAGGIGTLGASGGSGDPTTRMAYVAGTSACTMASSCGTTFVPGVWGPYYSAMFPNLWLLEGGQSAAGAAIATLVDWHPLAAEARKTAVSEGLSLLDWLERQANLAGGEHASLLAHGWQVLPEILGNRSPLANPSTRGAILGMEQQETLQRLVSLYVAVLCSLGYGLRQIVEAKRASGIIVDLVVISGGLAASPLIRGILADASGLAIARTESPEPVLLGSAIVAAVAAGAHSSVMEAATAMSRLEPAIQPPSTEIGAFHDRRYRHFLDLQSLVASSMDRSG